MKKILHKISFLMFIALFLGSCKPVQHIISYNREHIIENYSNYKTFLNGEKIAFDTIYFDEENIDTFEIHTKEKEIHITQIDKNVKYFSIENSLQKKGEGCCKPENIIIRRENIKDIIINRKNIKNVALKKIEQGAIKDIYTARSPESAVIYSNRIEILVIELK